MDRKHIVCALTFGVLALQTAATLIWPSTPTLTGVALAINAAAAVSTTLFLRRPAHAPWLVIAWCASFFGWHVLGLGTLADWWTPDLAAVFGIARSLELSIAYQAVATTLAAFAVHLALPRKA
ncbi:hypothetical protein FKR81_01075 [Lentzea tibetensis]|uniref:Uncharacterized protein n=1 Tax=Lentzea tibetensis TaxID=2591470 RepID=A0A563F2H6_9PSEU|nr:hypothetical protein [Lentzea tibetensis]TWP54186.1 hypothetical protein FKR81_01075 [Lentzea tibetensis]